MKDEAGRGSIKEGRIVTSRIVVLASFAALAAPAAWAQDHRVEIGAQAGWTLSDGVEGDAILAGDGNRYNSIEPKDAFSYSIDLGFFVNENRRSAVVQPAEEPDGDRRRGQPQEPGTGRRPLRRRHTTSATAQQSSALRLRRSQSHHYGSLAFDGGDPKSLRRSAGTAVLHHWGAGVAAGRTWG